MVARGSYWTPDGRYVGEFLDMHVTGTGRFTYPDGESYVGEFRDGKRQGRGTLYDFKKQLMLAGQWDDDKFVGPDARSTLPRCPLARGMPTIDCFGSSFKQGGVKYIGEFRGGQFDGIGAAIFPSGQAYVGEFQRGTPNGRGVVTERFFRYEGGMKDGQLHGSAKVTYTDGTIIVGEYRNGARNGPGTVTYPDGQRFVGSYRNDKRHGPGVLYDVDGGVISRGDWVDDRLPRPNPPE